MLNIILFEQLKAAAAGKASGSRVGRKKSRKTMPRSKPKPPKAMHHGKVQCAPMPNGTQLTWREPGASHILSGCARSSQSSLNLATEPKKYGIEKSSCASSRCQYGTVSRGGGSGGASIGATHARRRCANTRSSMSSENQRPQSRKDATNVTWQMRM